MNNLDYHYLFNDLQAFKCAFGDHSEHSHIVIKYVSTAEEIINLTVEECKKINLAVTSSEAVAAMTEDKTYKSIAITGGEVDNSIVLKGEETVIIDGLQINGEKSGGNGKINYTTPELVVKNVVINDCNSNYNVFEGSQKPADEDTLNKIVTVDNLTVDGVSLTHKVINVYTPANDAVITIKNSKFDINAAKSNVLRISNTPNSDNVNVIFENVDWTYENYAEGLTEDDWKYAGLVLYQPYGADAAFTGDLSHIATWKFTFKNCRYNGELIDASNFGEHSAVGYAYQVNGQAQAIDIAETGAELIFA